jgi:hypothetical protein
VRRNFQKQQRKVVYCECACGYDDHVLRVELTDMGFDLREHEEDSVDLSVGLIFPRYRFLRRLVYALRYVFDFRQRFNGFFGTFIVVDDVDKLVQIFQAYKKRVLDYRAAHNAAAAYKGDDIVAFVEELKHTLNDETLNGVPLTNLVK